jgi:hypothetical protein
LSRRGGGVTILPKLTGCNEPLHLLIDSTGLKMYGEGEWLDQQHGLRSRRRWRKLNLGFDAATQEIAAAELTPDVRMRADICNSYFCGGLGTFLKSREPKAPTVIIAGEGEKMRTSPALMP